MSKLGSMVDAIGGRLTLETGVPVSTADQTAKTTLYYTPYLHDRIALYDGAEWLFYVFTELSIAIPATTSQMYDVFCYNNAGTPTLELLAWTSDVARATALAYQNGILCKSGALTRRYLGSVRTTTVSGQTEDSAANRYVYNYYNRVNRLLSKTSSDSHAYTTAAWRAWNDSTAHRVAAVIGVAEDIISFDLFADNTISNAVSSYAGLCADNTNGGGVLGGGSSLNGYMRVAASAKYLPAIGFHYFQVTEYVAGNGCTFAFYQLNGAIRC